MAADGAVGSEPEHVRTFFPLNFGSRIHFRLVFGVRVVVGVRPTVLNILQGCLRVCLRRDFNGFCSAAVIDAQIQHYAEMDSDSSASARRTPFKNLAF